MSQDKVDSQDNELGADSPASKPLKKTRRTHTAESVALEHGVTVEQVLEANGNPKKTKGSHFVNKGKVDPILKKAKKLAEAEAKAEDDKPEPDITEINKPFFEKEKAASVNDAWAEQVAGDSDSHTSIEVEASTMAARLRIKLKQLLKLFGIEFDPQNDEANGLKKVDEAEAERLFQDVCDYFDAIAKAEAEAKAKADAEAKTKAKAKADAEAKAKQKKQPVAEAPVAEAEHQDVLSMADHIDRIRQMENAEAKAEAEAKSEADIAEAIARIKKEAEAKSKDETEEEVEASAEAETEVEAKDEQTPVPYIVCGPEVEEPEAPETPQLDEPEETPEDETASEDTVFFDDESTKQFIDQIELVIKQIQSPAQL